LAFGQARSRTLSTTTTISFDDYDDVELLLYAYSFGALVEKISAVGDKLKTRELFSLPSFQERRSLMASKPDLARLLYDFAISSKCSMTAFICAEVYFMRFCKQCPCPAVTAKTSRRIVAACMILGLKFADECFFPNDDYAYDLGVPSQVFNDCEAEMATLLGFKLFVGENEFNQTRKALEMLIEQESLLQQVLKIKKPRHSPMMKSTPQYFAATASSEDSIDVGDMEELDLGENLFSSLDGPEMKSKTAGSAVSPASVHFTRDPSSAQLSPTLSSNRSLSFEDDSVSTVSSDSTTTPQLAAEFFADPWGPIPTLQLC